MHERTDLYKSILRSMTGRYAVYTFNLLSMMILARIFSPQNYGTVAAIAVFFSFFQLMAEAGLGPAIINLERLEEKDRNGLFSLTLLAGILLALLFASLSPVFARFYNLPRVDEVVPYIAVSIFFFAASVIPNALLLRDQAFFKIANAGLIAEVTSTLAVITLSFYADPLHALAAKGPFSAACMFFIAWHFSSTTGFGRPTPGKNLRAILPLLNFSSYQFGFNFINFFSRNLDNILIGKYMGATSLGTYDKAYQLMKYPLMLLTFAMTPAIQPVIRKYSGDRIKVEAIHRDFALKLSLVGAAAGLAVFFLSEKIILVVLGNNWLEVAPIIKIIDISVTVQVVLSTSGSFFQAMNRADLLFTSGAISSAIMVTSISVGIIARDINLLCWSLVTGFHISFFQTYYFMYSRIFRLSMRRHLLGMIPAAIVVAVMAAYALSTQQQPTYH